MKVTTYFHPVSMLRMIRAITMHPVCTFMACTGIAVPSLPPNEDVGCNSGFQMVSFVNVIIYTERNYLAAE